MPKTNFHQLSDTTVPKTPNSNIASRTNAPWVFYAQFYKEHWITLTIGMIVALAHPAITILILVHVKKAFDLILPSGDPGPLLTVGAIIVLLYAFQSCLMLVARYAILTSTKFAVAKLRQALARHLLLLPHSFFLTTEAADLHTVLVEDSERLDRMSMTLVAQLLPAIPTVILLVGALLYLDWRLFLIVCAIGPFISWLWFWFRRRHTSNVRLFHGAFSDLSKRIRHLIHHKDLVHALGADSLELSLFDRETELLRKYSRSLAWFQEAFRQIQGTLTAFGSVFVLFGGGYLVIRNDLTVGELAAFFVALNFLRTHLHTLVSQLPDIIEGHESLKRLYAVASRSADDRYTGTHRLEFGGTIRLSQVSFSFPDAPTLFENIDLVLRPGERVVLQGPNGVGKSTFLRLILGLYHPSSGEVIADDKPYDQLDIGYLRQQFGVALQECHLVPGTIWDNITYGRSDATPELVENAARLSTASDFINRLPNRYESVLGDDGVGLSAGQGQRLNLARALLGRPPLLLLDEPTNNLDAESIERLWANLKNLGYEPAILIISHDPAAVSVADRVIRLENGKLVTTRESTYRASGVHGLSEVGAN